jgi:hypothetical protein
VKQIKSGSFLACFSPPVMVATFLIESALAIYTVYRYKLTKTGRIILGLLFCLGFFQLAEYFVCTQSVIALTASRAGYGAITLLPPLGLYLMAQLTKPLSPKLVRVMFLLTFMFIGYFLTARNAFHGYECTGNYVIFQIGVSQFYMYSTYYFGLLAASLWKGTRFLMQKQKKGAKSPVLWLIAGYLVFIIPVAVLVVFHPDTRAAVPSIMCGFAIGLAVILGAKIAPLTLKKR